MQTSSIFCFGIDPVSENYQMMHIDETDRKLLGLLQRHPDLTTLELSEKAGMSHTACWRRVKKFESTGLTERRVIIRDPAALGFTVNVIANVRLKQHDEETLNALESAVQKYPEIVECFSMSGDFDYLLRIIAKSIEDYERFLKATLLHLPGVVGVSSSFSLKKVKLTTDIPT